MITLRPYQQECKDAFYQYYAAGPGGHGLVVVPTAGGKSLIIGSLAAEIVQRWPSQRLMILSHVKELIEQNHEKLLLCWPAAPAGIYAASLKKRQSHFPIVSASIQSVYQRAQAFGHRDLVFIDEADLLNSEDDGMYREFLHDLLKINPNLKVCGFTATPYRMDNGPLTHGDNALFDDVIIEIPMEHLLEEGYLTPPLGKGSLVQADLEGVKTIGGEFNLKQMAAHFDSEAFINAALDDDLPYLADRRSIGVFAATLENAYHICDGLMARGVKTEVVDGTMKTELRESHFAAFKDYRLRALVSVGVMTTGTDLPNMDALLLFRATKSARLYQQIVGRGFRVMYAPGYDVTLKTGRLDAIRNGVKPNFLLLDHGGNIERHGPITNVKKPAARNKGERRPIEKMNGRICEICRTGHPIEVRICTVCGYEMVTERDALANLTVEASAAEVLGTPFSRGEVAQWFPVTDVRYKIHRTERGFSLQVTYYCGVMQFNEWIKPGRYNVRWWSERTSTVMPTDVDDMLARSKELKKPIEIMVRKKKNKWYEVLQARFQHNLLERA